MSNDSKVLILRRIRDYGSARAAEYIADERGGDMAAPIARGKQAWDDIGVALDALFERDRVIEAMTARIAELLARQQDLLALTVRLANDTPFSDEVAGWEAQRSAMIAEVGTLRARVLELEGRSP